MSGISELETPRFNVIEAFKSPIIWLVGVIVDLLLYVFSVLKLNWVVGVISIVAIIIFVVAVHYFRFCL
jgi:membrane protein YdbS with pleckstrin-like domain